MKRHYIFVQVLRRQLTFLAHGLDIQSVFVGDQLGVGSGLLPVSLILKLRC